MTAEIGLRVVLSRAEIPLLPLRYSVEALDYLATGSAYVQFDRGIGWLPTPDVTRASGGIRYHHNGAGLRADHEYAALAAPGTRRLAAYGDSFTYCFGVDLADCWTEDLQRLLPRAEVLNFGVPGQAPDQAWLRYQRDGANWQPCAVLIVHQVENINRVVNRFRPFYRPVTETPLAKPRYVLEGGRLVLLPNPARSPDELRDPTWVETNLGPRDAWYMPGTFVENPFDRLELVRLARTARFQRSRTARSDWTLAWAEQMYRPGSEAFEVLSAVLDQFVAQVRADGATPVVVVLPTTTDIAGLRDNGTKRHAPLLARLEASGVPVLDLTDDLAEASRATPLAELSAGHYRPAGNRVVAGTLSRELPGLTSGTCGPE